jgi:hypothetical protein
MIDCTHLDAISEVAPGLDVCEDCLPIGGRWVHLRQCLTCGGTRCCDNSPNRHATAHHHASGHPIVRAVTPVGEDWMWCYPDQLLFGEEDGELVDYGLE